MAAKKTIPAACLPGWQLHEKIAHLWVTAKPICNP